MENMNEELMNNLKEAANVEMTDDEEELAKTCLRRIFDLGVWLSEKPEQTASNCCFCGKEVKDITDLFYEISDDEDVHESGYDDALIAVEEIAILISNLLNRASDEFKNLMMDFRKEVLTEKMD